jgi:hypothetical protein
MNAAGAGVPQALIENHSALDIPCTEAAPVMAGATAGAEDIGAEDSVAGEFYISPAAGHVTLLDTGAGF